jgi:glucosylceramidase
MKKKFRIALLLASVAGVVAQSCSSVTDGAITDQKSGSIESWITTGDKTSLFTKSTTALAFSDSNESSVPVIQIDSTQQFQSIDGFGYALTGGSADLIREKLSESQQNDLLKELFSTDGNGIGISYLRVSIGASDLDDHVFTYNDLPAGQTDPELKNFTLKEDQVNLIPLLKKILAINPTIKIMGSPWTSPVWMKTNNLPKAGSLKPEFYPAYAQYFVKYIQGMAAEGITIDAVTIQNEPENPNNTPSLVMTAEQQRDFIKSHLGPAFEKASIKTKIVLFDHNCDHPQYPITVMNDSDAKKYVDGSAFHLYLGQIDALSTVRDAHPDKSIYFTEQWTWSKGEFKGDLRWHVKNLIVGATRNWSRNVLEWNLAADQNFDPHTDDGGCSECMGALTIGNTVTRNVSYYIIAHASKFVRPGSVRIGSTIVDGLHNVVFKTPEGKKVMVVVNDNDAQKTFSFRYSGKISTPTTLQSGAVGTYVW